MTGISCPQRLQYCRKSFPLVLWRSSRFRGCGTSVVSTCLLTADVDVHVKLVWHDVNVQLELEEIEELEVVVDRFGVDILGVDI